MSYSFRIDYRDGLTVHVHDNHNPQTLDKFLIKVHFNKKSITKRLEYDYNTADGKVVVETITNVEEFKIPWVENLLLNHNQMSWFYKGFVPYVIEIFNPYTNELLFTDKFDPRRRIVNFTLHSDDPKELHTWLCAISSFKKRLDCDISIKNDYLYQTQEYDWVSIYAPLESNFDQFYAGYVVGYFGTKEAPDYFFNPDGVEGKNSYEIIDDVLNFYWDKL
jgi:hypothetical protein